MSALASGDWLNLERIRRVAAICGLGSICLVFWLMFTSHGTLDWLGRPLGTDFSDVWAAGRMALDGHATDAWNWSKHFAVQRAIHGPGLTQVYAWHYPPPFLLVATVLGSMPYLPALITWQLVTFVPFLLLIQRIIPGRDSLLLTTAAPVTLFCLTQGQNGFLTATLLGMGLLLLDRRPIAGGLLIGGLIYKPQFILIISITLLAKRNRRAIVGAILAAVILIGATLILWGWPVWQAFVDSLPLTRSLIVEQGAAGFYKIMTPFAAIRMWGGPVSLAYAVQVAFTIWAAGAVLLLSPRADRPFLRNAVVCAATVLSTPYAMDYDLVVLLPALAWLYIDGEGHGYLTWDKSLMAAIWFAPVLARAAAQFLYLPLGLMTAVAVISIALRRLLCGDAMAVGDVHPGRKQQIWQPQSHTD